MVEDTHHGGHAQSATFLPSHTADFTPPTVNVSFMPLSLSSDTFLFTHTHTPPFSFHSLLIIDKRGRHRQWREIREDANAACRMPKCQKAKCRRFHLLHFSAAARDSHCHHERPETVHPQITTMHTGGKSLHQPRSQEVIIGREGKCENSGM